MMANRMHRFYELGVGTLFAAIVSTFLITWQTAPAQAQTSLIPELDAGDQSAMWDALYDAIPEYSAEDFQLPNLLPIWVPELDEDFLASAVSDAVPNEYTEQPNATVYADDSRTLFISEEKCRLYYHSDDRRFDRSTMPDTPVEASYAEMLATDAVYFLGVAPEELGAIKVKEVISGHVVHGLVDEYEEPVIETVTKETLVFFNREIDGISISGSRLVVIVSNDGDIARLKMRWPDLFLAIDLNEMVFIDKVTVTNEIHSYLIDKGTQTLEIIAIDIALVPVHPTANDGYIPAVQVLFKSTANSEEPVLVANFPVIQ